MDSDVSSMYFEKTFKKKKEKIFSRCLELSSLDCSRRCPAKMAHTHAKVHDLIFFLFFMSVCVCLKEHAASLYFGYLVYDRPRLFLVTWAIRSPSVPFLTCVCVCASMACYIYFFISICCFCFFLSFFETATTTAGAGSTRSPNSDVNQSSRLAPTHAGSDYTHFSLSLLFLSLSAS